MSEICDELQIYFESLTRDREKMATQVQNVTESLAKLQHHQGMKALTVGHNTHGSIERIEVESRHAMSEQPLFREDTLMPGGEFLRQSIATSSEVGSLQPPVEMRKYEVSVNTATIIALDQQFPTFLSRGPPKPNLSQQYSVNPFPICLA